MGYAGNQPIYGTFPSDLFTGNGSNTVFTMSSVPGNDAALLVTIDGVRQHTDTYSYSANTLTFSEAPGSGAIIETVNMGSRADVIITEGVYKKTQFTATAAQTNFTIPTGYTVGFVDVYLNGIRLVVADDYTATDGSTIILATPAANGDSVEVVAYGTFNVANALLKSGDTMSGNLVVSGTSTLMAPVAIANNSGNTFVVANTGAVTIGGSANIAGTLTAGSTTLAGNIIVNGSINANGNQLTITDSGFASRLDLVNTGTGGNTFIQYSTMNSFGQGGGKWILYNTAAGASYYIGCDTSGRITTPFQPALVATVTSNKNVAFGTNLQFDSISLNRNNAISVSNTNSRFTVPVAGYYVCSFSYFCNSTNDSAMNIKVNGSTVYRIGHNIGGLTGTASYLGGGSAIILSMAVNDYLEIDGSGSKTILGTSPVHSVMSFHLLG